MKTYSEKSIQTVLEELKDWKFVDKSLEKKFEFLNFSQALGFIVQVGLLAEKSNHHPDLFNTYDKVIIRLSTHDADGVTDKDVSLAKAIDKL